MKALVLQQVRCDGATLEAIVRVADGAPLSTSAVPGLAPAALEALPGLARHRCECGSARGMVAELASTELAHLLEHVTLEVMALSGSPRDLAGRTSWDFASDGPRTYRVRLAYDADVIAQGALEVGVRVVEGLLGAAPLPDIDAEVERLRELRAR